MFERLYELQLLEGYGSPIDINELIVDRKAIKILKKNPTLKQVFNRAVTFRAQQLEHNTIHGRWSFDVNNLRGLGARVGGVFILRWIGSHEEYNTESKKR
jgi:hypothetical protein